MTATYIPQQSKSPVSLLHFIDFSLIQYWDVITNLGKEAWHSSYPIVQLRTVLTQRKESITIDDNTLYKRCRVQWYGDGIALRDTVPGSVIKTKKQFPCQPNDFLVAEIDAKEGGFGVVPPELAGAIVSSHYFLFEIDESKLLPAYLGLFVKTKQFTSQVQAVGSTNYSAVRPYHVLEYLMALPPLAEQARLVDEYDRQMQEAEQKRMEAAEARKTFTAKINNAFGINERNTLAKTGLSFIESSLLVEWSVGFAELQDKWTIVPRFPRRRIGELCKVGSGGTPSRDYAEYYTNGTIPWVKTTEVVSKVIHDTEEKITQAALANSSAKVYPAGSLIIAMYGQGATRGRTAKLGIDASTNQACAVLSEINNTVIETDFLWVYLMNEYERLRSMASGTNQLNLNAGKIYNYLIQVPPLAMQQDICADYYFMQHTTSRLLAHAATLESAAKATFEAAIFA